MQLFHGRSKRGERSGKRYLSVSLLGQARFQHDQGEQAVALTNVEQALQIFDGLRNQIPIDAVRASFQAQTREAYELRTDLLMHLHERNAAAGYDATALQTSEANHARALVQLISEKHLLSETATDPVLTAQVDELRQRTAALTSEQVRLSPSTARRQVVEHELATLLTKLDEVTTQIRGSNPQAAALMMPAPLSLREIQQQLLDHDLLLEYELGEERSFLFVVAPDALHTFILPGRVVIEQKSRQVYELLSRRRQPKVFTNVTEKQAWLRRNNSDYLQAAAQLSTQILKPAARLLGNKRLMIIKSGMLQYVPFAALPAPAEFRVSGFEFRGENSKLQTTKRETQNSKPLVVDHEIITLPSASTLAELRREITGRKPARKILAVFGDPVFDRHDERLAPLLLAQVTQSAHVSGKRTKPLHAFGEVVESGATFVPRLPPAASKQKRFWRWSRLTNAKPRWVLTPVIKRRRKAT